MMHVLLDTNIYLTDVTFGKPEHEALKNYLQTAHGTIIMPNIVQREVEKNIKAKVDSEVKRISQLYSVSLGLIQAPPSAQMIEEALLGRFMEGLRRNRISNISHGETTLEQIVERSLSETPPFKSKGRGLRDALIWYSLLDFLRNNPGDTVAFITDNSQDFGKGSLSPELMDELTQLGFQERVFYFATLNDFLAKYSEPIAFIDNDFVYSAIESEANGIGESLDEFDLDIDYPSRDVDWRVKSVDYEEFEIESYYIFRTTETHYYLNVEVTFNMYIGLEGEYWDWDWDHYSNDFGHVAKHAEENVSSYITREIELKIDIKSREVEIIS